MATTNIFRNTVIPPKMMALTHDTIIQLTPTDRPYYYVRADTELPKKPGYAFVSTNNSIVESSTKTVADVSVAVVSPEELKTPGMLDELEFLESLGLAFEKADSWYCVKRADDLYSPTTGVFITYQNANKEDAKQKLKNLMLEYILPGRYWTNYFVAMGLPKDIAYGRNLYQEMEEITREYNEVMMKNPPV
jgi:hypothetical protein